MPLFNTPTSYGAVTKAFHWLMAVIMIMLLVMGLSMDDIKNLTDKLWVYGLHKSLGITILALVFLRAAWHVYSRRPDPVETLSKLNRLGAAAMHYALYVLMVLMPLSGWAMSSAAGRPVQFFGLFTLPDFVAADPALAKILRERHEQIGTLIIACLALHAGAALWHHFIVKDGTLKRMLPALALFMLIAAPAQALAPSWNLQHEQSALTFRPKQMGQEFKGSFGTYSAAINFSPDDLANSKVVVVVQIGTAVTGAPDRDANLKGAEWFDVVKFPEAKFESTSFRKTGDNAYIASGTLTIRDVSLPLDLPFTLTIKDGPDTRTATMDATVVIDRSKYKIGVGQWADTSIIANEVPVDIHVVALGGR